MFKWRIIKWVRHVLHMGKGEEQIGFWWTFLKKRYDKEGMGISGRIILKYIVGKSIKMVWIGLVWLRTGEIDGALGSR
jgi:hypothetical protein